MPKEKTDKRDQAGTVCAVIAVMLVALMIAFIILGPYKDFKASERELARLRDQETLAYETRLEEQQNRQRLEQLVDRLRARPRGFDLGAFMSKILRDTKLAERSELKSLPTNSRQFTFADNLSMVEVKLKSVSLEDLVDFFHATYAGKNLIVLHKMDSIRPAPGDKGLDCNATFIAPKA